MEIIFDQVVSNLIQLLSMTNGILTNLIAIPGITPAMVTTNIPVNVAPANALVSFRSATFSFRGGALYTTLTGILVQPWKIFRSIDKFIYMWLMSYSAVIGPIADVLLEDYYVVWQMQLDVEELYSSSVAGRCYYTGGYSMMGIAMVMANLSSVVPSVLH